MAIEKCTLLAIEKCTVGIGCRGGSEATGAGTDAWIWSPLMSSHPQPRGRPPARRSFRGPTRHRERGSTQLGLWDEAGTRAMIFGPPPRSGARLPSRVGILGREREPEGHRRALGGQRLERAEPLPFGRKPGQIGVLDHVVERRQTAHEHFGRGHPARWRVSSAPSPPVGATSADAADLRPRTSRSPAFAPSRPTRTGAR